MYYFCEKNENDKTQKESKKNDNYQCISTNIYETNYLI